MNVNDCNLEDAWGRLDGLYSTCSKKEKEKWCLCYVQQNNLLKILLHLVRSLPVPFNTTKCEIIFNGTTASLELLHDLFQLNKIIYSLSTRAYYIEIHPLLQYVHPMRIHMKAGDGLYLSFLWYLSSGNADLWDWCCQLLIWHAIWFIHDSPSWIYLNFLKYIEPSDRDFELKD